MGSIEIEGDGRDHSRSIGAGLLSVLVRCIDDNIALEWGKSHYGTIPGDLMTREREKAYHRLVSRLTDLALDTQQ